MPPAEAGGIALRIGGCSNQATDPTSPWYNNMTTLYSQKKWVSLPYTTEQLAQDHGARSVTLPAP